MISVDTQNFYHKSDSKVSIGNSDSQIILKFMFSDAKISENTESVTNFVLR